MATAAVLSPELVQETLARWRGVGPTAKEQDDFIDEALSQLNDSEHVTQFQKNISEIADASLTIDKTFSEINAVFDSFAPILVLFPQFKVYTDEWKSFRGRWRTCLRQSCEVAEDSVSFLKRFDTVYLDMVENIQTEDDRLAAIKALEEFTEEKHDGSVEMSQGFLGIKRDIEAFVKSFEDWIASQGAQLTARAQQLKRDIAVLLSDIEDLDAKIKNAKLALAIAGGFLFFIGLAIAGGVLASLQSQRNAKDRDLKNKQSELDGIKAQEQMLGIMQAGLDAWKPNIALLCDKLLVFAETWASVRSQSVQFRGHLLGGMDAATNMRFKREVRLARSVCTPLVAGLEEYKAAIESTSGNWN